MRKFWCMLLSAAMLFALTGCGVKQGATAGKSASSAKTHAAGLFSAADFENALRLSGYSFTVEGNSDFMVFSGASREILTVGKDRLELYSFKGAAQTEQQASCMSADGFGYSDKLHGNAVQIDWVSPPRFYKSGCLIVLYVGTDPQMIADLQNIFGRPFAGVADGSGAVSWPQPGLTVAVRAQTGPAAESPCITRIDSVAQLGAYARQAKARCSLGADFDAQIRKYGADYFKGSVLLVAAFCEPSGSIGHHVGSLVKAGSSLQVHLLRWLPQTQTADRAFWQIFIEAGREVVRGVSSVELKTHDVQLSAQDTAARAAAYDALGAGDKKHILVRPEDAAIGIVSGWQAFSASAQKNYKSTALYHIVFETDNRGLLGDACVYVEPGASKPAGFDLRE